MLAAETRCVVKEIMVYIQRIGHIHFCRIGENDIRLDAACCVAFQFMAFLPFAVVDGLDASARWQVILAGRHFDVTAECHIAHVLYQPFAEGALADERRTVKVL